ncbi:MAG: right-handed parallel beta-helix repeat-containing protein [Phycisphaerae bacterium]|nr:right-handed parallel beta-helix repeat-containing protein [Phycisphaerae bacterium]
MHRILITMGLVMVSWSSLCLSAEGPNAPKITSWSNSKTADQKTVFAVKSGEKITLTIKADGAEKYLWQVDKAVQKGSDSASFTWTVPDKKGLWKIQVKSVNKSLEQYVAGLAADFRQFHKKDVPPTIEDGYYPPQCRKEWIVSTFLKKVKPGESIQKTIDAIPAEGGIVELQPGLHKVTETIRINKSNVAVQGTDDSEIRSSDPEKHVFIVNEDWKGKPALENVTFRGFKITAGKKTNKSTAILTRKVKGVTVEGVNASWFARFVDTGGSDSKNPSSEVSIRNNTADYCQTKIFYTTDVVVAYNTLNGRRAAYVVWHEPRTAGAYASMHHNHVKPGGGNSAGFQTEGQCAHFFNNKIDCGGRGLLGITIRYYPSHTRVENNIITGATGAGIQFYRQSTMLNNWVKNNLIFNCSGHGIIIGDLPYRGSKISLKRPYEVNIVNNVICNNGKDGIARGARKSNDPWTININNNIIANNGGYGINLVDEFIKGTRSYNNVWKNKKGNYKESRPGAGDISVDPLFADAAKGDFHLKSKAGRWDPKAKKWVKDAAQSPCIDAGEPKADFSKEPVPNGGRINIGAYGNTKGASKSRPEQTKTPPSVKLWDVGEKHPWHNGFKPYAKQELWKQVPYGETNHKFKGDAVIENEFFYLYFYRTITLHGKVDGKPRIWRNVLYKVYVDPDGRRNYGHSQPKYFKIIKNTNQEIVVEHQGGKSVTTTYRFPVGKPWFEVRGVKSATELGIHGKVRMGLAPVEGGNDFVVDSLRDPPGRPNAPDGKMILCFYENITNPCMWVFTWTSPFKEAAPWFLNDSGPKGDTMWCSPGKWGGLEIPRKWPGCITSSWAKFGKDGGVVLGALVYPNNWYRQQVGKPVKKGNVYTSKWKPPYPGRWRMTVRVAEKKYDQGFKYDGKTKFPAKYFSKDVYDGNFTFKSPMDGILDYVIMYMYDRTKDTPSDIQTPMDQYRWTVRKQANKKGDVKK